jgi:hypothetical protein
VAECACLNLCILKAKYAIRALVLSTVGAAVEQRLWKIEQRHKANQQLS